jgi:hypothetical protein
MRIVGSAIYAITAHATHQTLKRSTQYESAGPGWGGKNCAKTVSLATNSMSSSEIQAVTQIAANRHASAGTFVIGQIEISSEVASFAGRTEEGTSFAFAFAAVTRS